MEEALIIAMPSLLRVRLKRRDMSPFSLLAVPSPEADESLLEFEDPPQADKASTTARAVSLRGKIPEKANRACGFWL
jgi:hypothetical protein